jgi:protein gp37
MNKWYKRFKKESVSPHIIDKEFDLNLGTGHAIFVCTSCDLFADTVANRDIRRVINKCDTWPGANTYLFHTKKPQNALWLPVRDNFILCATIESDRWHDAMGKAPSIWDRFSGLRRYNGRKMIAIEPIMDFNTDEFMESIMECNVEQANIGADSGNNRLPEPSPEKIAALIEALRSHNIKVYLKPNLKRL